ncbi:MAG: hypothetical protein Q7T55_01295 [Solirubrobacteraceae bacterium]|nr:hypothetical protein [Solirubrobacteraceae bacterium]
MNLEPITHELDRMAGTPGIVGCALVEAATGLVWHTSGHAPTGERVWEAAIDYWRLHERQKEHFTVLGPLGAAVMYHARGVLAVLPCSTDPEVLVVTSAAHRGVDWTAWQRRVRALGGLMQRAA